LRPFLFLIVSTIAAAFEFLANGSESTIYQWSNTHYGNAFPCVIDLKCSVKPNDSATGK
jgi:hypothetical protein